MLLADAIAAFLVSCEAANYSSATRRIYAYKLERLLRASGLRVHDDVAGPGLPTVLQFKPRRRNEHHLLLHVAEAQEKAPGG